MNKKQILSKLYKEFKVLEKGKQININISPQSISIPVKVCWESDSEATYCFDDNKLMSHAYAQADKACKLAIKPFTKNIESFVDKCDKIADKFSEDRGEFFNEIMDYGSAKERSRHTKQALKKQIMDTETQLKKLKTHLNKI